VLCSGRMLEIPVELGPRRYTVSVGHGLARMLPDLLGDLRGRGTVVVASRRVWALHAGSVERSLRRLAGSATPARRRAFHVCLIPDGERFKTRRTLESVYDAFLEARLTRDGLVVAVGGGVTGDLAGFAAASWMRGVDWVGIPTTLVAMVDSSIGGKVGINHARAKNMIGAFHQPRAVVIDPAFLATLPLRELRSGAYEILKCAILGDRALFAALGRAPAGLTGWQHPELENAIATACRIKAEVVERDEREAGLRRVLNLGHTIGHALEATTGYRRFTHGEAVGWGLVGAAWIARRRELLPEPAYDAIASAVDHVGPRPRVSGLPTRRILEALSHDKKTRDGRLPFVLPTAIGRVVVRDDVTRAEVAQALRVMAAREVLSPPTPDPAG
jgi:3-dehydroquinate synthase